MKSHGTLRAYIMVRTGISLIALLAATPALAQDDDIIVTASGIEQSRDEVGQAITVIDAQTIQTRQAIDVVDADTGADRRGEGQ